MPVWLTIGIVIAVLFLVAGVVVWWTRQTGNDRAPRLDIEVHSGSAGILRTTSVRGREELFTLTVTNVGRIATTVEDVYLDVPDGWRLKMNVSFEGRSLLQGDRPLPCRLEPGESVSYGVPGQPLTRQLKEMGVRLSDQRVTVQVLDVDKKIYQTEFATEQFVE